MIPVGNNIYPALISNNDITPFKSDQILINQWQEWAKNAQSGVGEKRDIALLRLMDSLERGSVSLDLSRLNLTDLPEDLPPSLKRLNINLNQLTFVPETLPKSLDYLDVSYNRLTFVPETLPKSLESLHVSYNRLTFVPETLPKSLELLDVSHNRLTSLPENLPKALRKLYIIHNQLRYLPETLPDSLKVLNASCNQLTFLPDALPKSLELLDVIHNQLACLPEKLPESLKLLNVSHNQLTFVPETLPKSLERLGVSFNLLICLPRKLPETIEVLNVSHNQLTSLPEVLPKSLDSLNVSHNRLTSLPKDLPVSCRLRSEGNPLADNSTYLNFVKTLYLWNEQININPWNKITQEENSAVFSDFLAKLYQENNASSGQLRRTVSEWLDYLVQDENIELRRQTFAVAQEGAESRVGRASDYFDQMYSLMAEHRLIEDFVETLHLWDEQVDINPWKKITQEENAAVFSDFLTKLCQGNNAGSAQLKQTVSAWLNYLARDENIELRRQTFAVAQEGTESCVDRASHYFNQMYSLMIEHRLIKDNASVSETFKTLRGVFRMQELEKIAASHVQQRRENAPGFEEDIEVYFAYQYHLRDVLALPVYTQLQFGQLANLTENDVRKAKNKIIGEEKQNFLRYLVNDSAVWSQKIREWNGEKIEATESELLEKVDEIVSGSNSFDVAGMKSVTDKLKYDLYFPLTREFLQENDALSLLDEVVSGSNSF